MSSDASTESVKSQSVVDRTSLEGISNHSEDEDMEIPDNLEDIIEILLSGLRDTVCIRGEILLKT